MHRISVYTISPIMRRGVCREYLCLSTGILRTKPPQGRFSNYRCIRPVNLEEMDGHGVFF